VDQSITAAELKEVATTVLILDVRKAKDRTQAHVPGALWKDPEMLATWSGELPKDRRIVVYCVHGHAVSQGVCTALLGAGFSVRYLAGGIEGWKATGGAVLGE
jgi:Fe-Mn family superoxide dismutase